MVEWQMNSESIRPAPQDLLTRRELAAQLKCSVAAIRVWQKQGLPVHRLGRLCRYRLNEVLDWFARKKRHQQ
jgi:phage terminase Nu1 subunit (DNA packaging protein)